MHYHITKMVTMHCNGDDDNDETKTVSTWWSSFAKHPISRPSCFPFLIRIITSDHHDQYDHFVARYDDDNGSFSFKVMEI